MVHSDDRPSKAGVRTGDELRAVAERSGAALADAPAEEVIGWAAQEFGPHWCVTTSFADAVLVHLVSRCAPGIDVVFLDTGYHFAQTLQTRRQVETGLPVRVVSVQPELSVRQQDERYGPELYRRDPDLCCQLRKVAPLAEALAPYEAWAAGLRRDESPQRAGTRTVDFDGVHGKVKICPLAAWSRADVERYAERHRVPVNPLVRQGYPSVGCAPCTRPVGDQDSERAGRWPLFDKAECGIHEPAPPGDAAHQPPR